MRFAGEDIQKYIDTGEPSFAGPDYAKYVRLIACV